MNLEGESPPHHFGRSASQRIVGGVCGGLAEHFDLDVRRVRAGVALTTALTAGTAALLYLALWMLLPE